MKKRANVRLADLTETRNFDKDEAFLGAWIGPPIDAIFYVELENEDCRRLISVSEFDERNYAMSIADYTYLHELTVSVKNNVDTLLSVHLDKRSACKHYEKKRLLLHNEAFIAML